MFAEFIKIAVVVIHLTDLIYPDFIGPTDQIMEPAIAIQTPLSHSRILWVPEHEHSIISIPRNVSARKA
jgi:hypothetical protein